MLITLKLKRLKLSGNSTYMWHCRLGHIGMKRMMKLHSDGLLESLDFESLERCEACLMGKMTETPFSGMMERATDLFGNQTYRCVWSNECSIARWLSLCSHLHG